MINKLGVNILAGGDYNELKLVAFLDRLQPKALVVMDNPWLAMRLQERYPLCLVIYRSWPDDNISRLIEPRQWLDRMLEETAGTGLTLYAGNEPGYDVRQGMHVTWMLEAMEYASSVGRKLVVGNYSVGTPGKEEWQGGLKPLLEKVCHSEHYLGVHEYFDYHNWRYPGYDPLKGQPYLIGRYTYPVEVAEREGWPDPKIVVTELGADVAESQNPDYRGWKAGSGLSEEAYANQLMLMNGFVYQHPAIVGTCIFCWE